MTKLRMSRITGAIAALLLLTVNSAIADDCIDECHDEAMDICNGCEYGDDDWADANEWWELCVDWC